MMKTSSSSENKPCCSKSCKKNTDSLNSKITKLTDKLDDSENVLFHYKAGLAQVEARLAEHRNQEVKYWNCIESLTKELELIKKEKEGLESKLTGFQTASKDLDSLLESQRLDKNKEGLGYSAVPPPLAQVYSPPKKDLSWTRLLEFADDTVTDYSRAAPTIESSPDDVQNKNPSVTKTEASPSTISSKPFIKFVKAADRSTEDKTDKKETARKSTVKYVELYRKPSKKSTVRGNQINWNNLKSQQLDHGRSWVKNNNTHKTHSYAQRPFQRESAVRTQSQVLRVSTVCCCCSRQVNTARPKEVINRRNWVNDIKASACWVWKSVKPNSASIILKKYDYVDGNSGTKLKDSVRTKRSRGSKSTEVVDYILQVKKKLLTKKLEDSKAEHQV
nr:hypothetical protein [Tanacetum cinerariifolium]